MYQGRSGKQFSPLWTPSEAHVSLFMCGKDLIMLLKHVQVGLSDRDDRESSFNRCGSPVSLVQACLCGAKA